MSPILQMRRTGRGWQSLANVTAKCSTARTMIPTSLLLYAAPQHGAQSLQLSDESTLQNAEQVLIQMPAETTRKETWGRWAGVCAYGDTVAEWWELWQTDEHMPGEGRQPPPTTADCCHVGRWAQRGCLFQVFKRSWKFGFLCETSESPKCCLKFLNIPSGAKHISMAPGCDRGL